MTSGAVGGGGGAMGPHKIQKCHFSRRTTGIPKMSLFEIDKIRRTKVQMSRATKQSDKELSEGPDHD